MGKHAAAPPTAIVSPSDQIGQLLGRGQLHHQAGQLAEAENYYRKVLAIDPNDFDGLRAPALGKCNHSSWQMQPWPPGALPRSHNSARDLGDSRRLRSASTGFLRAPRSP